MYFDLCLVELSNPVRVSLCPAGLGIEQREALAGWCVPSSPCVCVDLQYFFYVYLSTMISVFVSLCEWIYYTNTCGCVRVLTFCNRHLCHRRRLNKENVICRLNKFLFFSRNILIPNEMNKKTVDFVTRISQRFIRE